MACFTWRNLSILARLGSLLAFVAGFLGMGFTPRIADINGQLTWVYSNLNILFLSAVLFFAEFEGRRFRKQFGFLRYYPARSLVYYLLACGLIIQAQSMRASDSALWTLTMVLAWTAGIGCTLTATFNLFRACGEGACYNKSAEDGGSTTDDAGTRAAESNATFDPNDSLRGEMEMI